MKKIIPAIVCSLALFLTAIAQEQPKQENIVIIGDNPNDVCVFYDEIKDTFVKNETETDVEHIARIKSSLTAKQFKGKSVSEIVLVIQDGFRYESSPQIITADFYNRKIADSDFILNVETLKYGYLVNGLEVPEMPAALYDVPQIKQNLKLAVYGFPVGCDRKYKVLKFAPLRYVFFNGATSRVYSDGIAKNQFAEYYLRSDVPPEGVLQLPDDFGVNFGSGVPTSGGNKTVFVRSYTRRDGTYVRSHTRRPPSRRP